MISGEKKCLKMAEMGESVEGGKCNDEGHNLENGLNENKDKTRLKKLGVTIKFWTMEYEVDKLY